MLQKKKKKKKKTSKDLELAISNIPRAELETFCSSSDNFAHRTLKEHTLPYAIILYAEDL